MTIALSEVGVQDFRLICTACQRKRKVPPAALRLFNGPAVDSKVPATSYRYCKTCNLTRPHFVDLEIDRPKMDA